MNASDMHVNGVHTKCIQSRTRLGDGTWRQCPQAGRVDRFHGHDFDGPLWAACGCDE
jgi:hypothetical protein